MTKNRWFWTAVLIAVMSLILFWDPLLLWMASPQEQNTQHKTTAISAATVPWSVTASAAPSDNRVWGVKKPSAAAKASSKATGAAKKKRVVVSVKKVKERHYVCIDRRCLVLLGINSEDGQRYALFMRLEPSKQKPGDYTREEKILRFKEGEMIEKSVLAKEVRLHKLVLYAPDTNQTYSIKLFDTDIGRYRIGGGAPTSPKGASK